MLKEKDYIFSRLNIVLDSAITGFAVLLAHVSRNYVLAPFVIPDIFRYPSYLRDYWWLIILLPLLTVSLLAYYGYYKSQRIRSFRSLFTAIVFSTVGASLTAIVISFVLTPRGAGNTGWFHMFSEEFISRGVLLLFAPIAIILLSLKTLAVRSFLVNLRNRGLNSRSLLLVGNQKYAQDFLEQINRHPYWGFKVNGIITEERPEHGGETDVPVVGSYSDLFTFLENNVIDEVVFVTAAEGMETLAPMLRGCEEMGIRTRVPIYMLSDRIAKPVLETFDDISVLTFNPVREFGGALFFKYLFDRIAAAVILILFSPVMLVLIVLIKLTSASWRDSAFHGQKRCGLNGRQFVLWKFRSMAIDAEEQRARLEEYNEMSGPVFKMRNDPRVTRIGRWLRKTSMDELPQFWNVLRGEMSIVGPRPPLPGEVSRYDRWQRRRLSMKPGITCIWQVSGRNQLSFEKWMELDLKYIDNWSLGLDFRIILKTIYVVATGYGAM